MTYPISSLPVEPPAAAMCLDWSMDLGQARCPWTGMLRVWPAPVKCVSTDARSVSLAPCGTRRAVSYGPRSAVGSMMPLSPQDTEAQGPESVAAVPATARLQGIEM